MMQNKRIYAITGGIGSGKTLLSSFIRQAGYPVFSCDDIYAELAQGGEMVQQLESAVGNVTLADGSLDRKALAARVFGDKKLLGKLNGITHPAIMRQLFLLAQNSGSGIVFCEVPLLFESGLQKYFDGVIVLLRSVKERVHAVMERSGLTEEEVLARIKNQYDYDSAELSKYYVVHNDGDAAALKEKIIKIIQNITKLA